MLLTYNSSKLEQIMNINNGSIITNPELIQQYKALRGFKRNEGYFDRSGTVRCFANIANIRSIPEYEIFTKSFEDICHERALQIINTGKLINFYWSGGIDSTTSLCALLNCGIKKDQLKIIMTYNSILEYPLFYKNYVRRLDHKIRSIADIRHYFKFRIGEISLTSEIGDQIFGGRMALVLCPDTWENNYRTIVPVELCEIIEPTFSKCWHPIENLFDFHSWVNFCWKYQHVVARFLASVTEKFPESIDDHLIHFFDTEDFQKWSLSNPDKKVKHDLKSWKYIAKEFIYETTKDEYYMIHKIKVDSSPPVDKNAWWFIGSDRVYREDDFICRGG